MSMYQLKECPRCSGDLYLGTDSYGQYRGCLQCGQEYYPLAITGAYQTNGNKTKKEDVNLEDKCMLIFCALSGNEEGLALTTIARYTDAKVSAPMKKYLEIMQMGGYVSIDNENDAGNETFKITPEGRTVFREYKDLVTIVEDEAQFTFDTYRFFDNRGRLTKFGSFVKDVAKKTPEQYLRLGEFTDKTQSVISSRIISSRSRSRKKKKSEF